MTLGDFTQQAEAYGRSRPTYPAELLDALISDADLQAGDPVADFGAGTGIFTELLVDRGFAVSAIEPNESMRNHAHVTHAQWIDGTFENSRLKTASQRWAAAAQAFHWADPARCLPEIYRILQSGRLFTVLWNDRVIEFDDVVRWTENLIRRQVPEFDEAYRRRPWNETLELTGHFRMVNHRTIRHSVSMSRERFLELWKSHNRLNTVAGTDRFSRFIAELAEHLQDQCGEDIQVYYDCNSWSARRVD